MSTDTTPEPAEQPRTPPEPPHGTGAARELPAVVQRLWGAAAPRRRGPRPALSVAQIVQAALDLADAEGLAAVSMARIADAVGYTPMALYRHVSGKEELLVLMADAVRCRPARRSRTVSAGGPGSNAGRVPRSSWASPAHGCSSCRCPPRRPDRTGCAGSTRPSESCARSICPPTRSWRSSGCSRSTSWASRASTSSPGVRRCSRCVRESGLPDGTPESELDPAAIDAANPYADFETVLGPVCRRPRPTRTSSSRSRRWPENSMSAHSEDDVAFGISVVLDGVEAFLRRCGALPDDGS